MPNILAPFGFRPYSGRGAMSTQEQVTRRIASNNTTAIFTGDPVVSLNTGYITQQAAAQTSAIHGIFVGCEYLSTALGRRVWSPYWPGTGATGDVIAYVINDPNMEFVVQVGSTGIAAFTDININVNFIPGSGNTSTGISAAVLDMTTAAVTTTLPFRIVDLVRDPPGANGTDFASANNYAIVAFNNVDTRNLTGI